MIDQRLPNAAEMLGKKHKAGSVAQPRGSLQISRPCLRRWNGAESPFGSRYPGNPGQYEQGTGDWRVTYPITLTVSTGRCGTSFLASTFQENFSERPCWISHEFIPKSKTAIHLNLRCYDQPNEGITDAIESVLGQWMQIARNGPVVDFGHSMIPLIPGFYERLGSQLRVLHLVRHPIQVAASHAAMGFYADEAMEWFTPHSPGANFRYFATRWPAMSPFEKNLYRWLEIVSYGLELRERYSALRFRQVRSEDIFNTKGTLESIAEFAGFESYGKIRPAHFTRQISNSQVERYPIGKEWMLYQRHPEVLEMAEHLGYCMEAQHVNALLERYRPSNELGARLRQRVGYWKARERLGAFLRR